MDYKKLEEDVKAAWRDDKEEREAQERARRGELHPRDDVDQLKSENERLRKIACQMFGCISLSDMWSWEVPLDGNPIDVYNAWLKEFGTDTYTSPTPPASPFADNAQNEE